MGRLSSFISYIFHPLLIPTYTFVLLFWAAPHLVQPLSFMSLPFLFITTFMLPILSLGVLKASGSISSFKMENREDRLVPFVYIFLFFVITCYLFIFKIGVNDLVATIFVTTTVLILVLTVVTFRFKVSIHAASMTGLLGYLFAIQNRIPEQSILWMIITVLILSGGVMSARLYLQAHTIKEILVGALLGFVICFVGLFFFA